MPGPNARYKKTEICRSCAKSKNVCQTCVFDLKYGLPVQVRDALLAQSERVALPENAVNRQYALRQLEAKMDANGGTLPQYEASNPVLERLARRAPSYDRNRAHVCSFFARGACARGELCPYRHELAPTGDLAKQNIKDRFHGTNDPLAAKILQRAAGSQKLTPPEDASITTLWLGALPDAASESDIREAMAPFGDISSVRLVPAKQCAFVTYFRRGAAEEAALRLSNSLYIAGKPVRMAWGKRQSTAAAPGSAAAAAAAGTLGAGFAATGAPAGAAGSGAVPPPPGAPAAGSAGVHGHGHGHGHHHGHGHGKDGNAAAAAGARPQTVYPSMMPGYMATAAALPKPPGM